MSHRSKNYNEDNEKNNNATISLADRINDLELYYADTVLPENLKMIYAQIQEDCSEFRNNIFFKMLDIFEADLVRIFQFNYINRENLEEKNQKLFLMKNMKKC